MAQYKVLKEFRLLDDPKVSGVGPVLKIGQEIDMTVARAKQVEKTLDSSFLVRVEEEKEQPSS